MIVVVARAQALSPQYTPPINEKNRLHESTTLTLLERLRPISKGQPSYNTLS
jgi:hypothetical protein